jgi:energy-coupling factor transport system permease protein
MSQTENSLQYIDRTTIIHSLYPLAKLAWVFLIAIGLFFFQTPLSGAVLFTTVLIVAIVLARVPIITIIASSKVIFGLAFLLMIFHFFADPGQPVYQVGPLTVTDVGW